MFRSQEGGERKGKSGGRRLSGEIPHQRESNKHNKEFNDNERKKTILKRKGGRKKKRKLQNSRKAGETIKKQSVTEKTEGKKSNKRPTN